MATTPPSTTFAIATSPPSPSTRRSLSFGGDRDPLRLPLAPPRGPPRLEMFAVEKAPKPSAPLPRRDPSDRPGKWSSRRSNAGSGSLAPVARASRSSRPAERGAKRGNEERGDGKEPRPSPIVPAEPLKRLSPEPSPQRATEPRRVLNAGGDARVARGPRREDGARRSRRGRLSPDRLHHFGNGFVDAIVCRHAANAILLALPARVDVGSAVVSESVASMMPPPPPVPRTSSRLLRRRDPSWRVRR